jgi:hypothetical protein
MLTAEEREAVRAACGKTYRQELVDRAEPAHLRDYFAMSALEPLIDVTCDHAQDKPLAWAADVARLAYTIADAMLAERERK